MKLNGKKIRSKSMKKRKNWKQKLNKMNKECKNRIMIKKIEKKLGLHFLTNFIKSEERDYERAIYNSNMQGKVKIIDRAYYANGKGIIKYMKALYCTKDVKDLSPFWRLIDKYTGIEELRGTWEKMLPIIRQRNVINPTFRSEGVVSSIEENLNGE